VADRGQAGDQGRPDISKDRLQGLGGKPEAQGVQRRGARELGKWDTVLVDVRGPKEFSGEILAPPEYPTEHAQRGGHIPGAKNIPWVQTVNDSDGTFKTRTRSRRCTPKRASRQTSR